MRKPGLDSKPSFPKSGEWGFCWLCFGYNSAPTHVFCSMREPRAAPKLGAAFFRKWAQFGLACCCFLAVVWPPHGGPDERFWCPPAPGWGAPHGARLALVRHASVVFVATGGRKRIPPFHERFGLPKARKH